MKLRKAWYTTMNNNLNTNEPKTKNHKKAHIIIVSVVAVFIIAAISTIIYFKNRLSPSEKLIKGYTELFKVSENYIADGLDIEKISESKKSTANLELTADSFPYEPQLEGLGINSIVAKNIEKKKLENITGITYCGTAVMSSDIYIKNNKLYISIPSLFDNVLTIDLSKIEELKDSSYILQQIPDDVYKSIDMSVFQDIWNVNKDSGNPITFADYIKETSPEEWQTICKGIKVSKVKDSNDIKLSLSGSSIKLFLEKSVDVISENESFNSNLERIRDNHNGNYTLEEVHSGMKNMVSVLSLFFSKGLDIYTSFNSDNQITAIKCEHNYKFMGIKMNISVDVNYKGKEYPKDDYTGSIVLDFNGQELNFSFNKKQELKDKGHKVNSESIYSLCYNDVSLLDIKISSGYTRTHNEHNALSDFLGCTKTTDSFNSIFTEYDISVNISSDLFIPFTFDIELSGDISDVEKGNSFTLNFEKIKAAFNSQDIISLSGSYSITAKASSIGKPDGDTLDLLKMNQTDFSKLNQKINKNIDKLFKSYSELKD